MTDLVPPQEWVDHNPRDFSICPTCFCRIEPGCRQEHLGWHQKLVDWTLACLE